MSTQTRTPAGVPTGGQFASSTRAEASIDPWGDTPTSPPGRERDSWAVPRDPFRPLLAGLDETRDSEFRDLDEPVSALRAETLALEEKKRYLVLAASVDGAMASGSTGWVPDCPVHTVGRSDGPATEANRWGNDADCTACTENGSPLPLRARLTVPDRLTSVEVESARDRIARAQAVTRIDAAESALNHAKATFTVNESQADSFDGDQWEAKEDFDAAFDQAMFCYYGDKDHAVLADALELIAENEGARFANLIDRDDDSEGLDWLRTAAARFRRV